VELPADLPAGTTAPVELIGCSCRARIEFADGTRDDTFAFTRPDGADEAFVIGAFVIGAFVIGAYMIGASTMPWRIGEVVDVGVR
jgi:hypothetical protein